MQNLIDIVNNWLPSIVAALTSVASVIAVIKKLSPFDDAKNNTKETVLLKTKVSNLTKQVEKLTNEIHQATLNARGVKNDKKN